MEQFLGPLNFAFPASSSSSSPLQNLLNIINKTCKLASLFCCDIHSATSPNLHLSSDQYQRNFGSTWRSPENIFADLFKLFECGSLTQQLLFSVSHLLPQSMEVASSCSLVSTSDCSQRRSCYNYTYCGQWTTTCTRAPFSRKSRKPHLVVVLPDTPTAPSS